MLIYQVFRHMKTLASFDYKYSTVNFESSYQSFGQYVGYDSGAIWRIGIR
jgi:hypothetical protein